ncbi:MAG: class I SAM-dependent methyltransferase [Kiloniellaceae bacterium]
MSRLDSVIRRLQAQRACLERAVDLVRGLPGPVLELGLGQGRTFDHLRELCPEREIFVFDRQVAAAAECTPDADHLYLGDIRRTLPEAAARFARAVPLVHSDIGTGHAGRNAELAAFLAVQLPMLLRPRGVVVSDQDLAHDGAVPLPLPAGVAPGRYFMYRIADDRPS